MDETGISTVPKSTPKVITPKGRKTVCKISSTERGQGVFVLPVLILPRKRMNPLLYKDARNGTLPLISDAGYMNSHLFIDWLKHFVKHAKLSTEDPVLSTARVQLAEKAFPVADIEPNNLHIISEDWYSPSLVTVAPLDNDCTVAVAPEENEASSSTSQIDVSIQSILPLPRHEQRGAKRKRKSQKSEIMTSSPFKNFLDKNEKEKVELEESKAIRVFKINKNGDKTKKRKALKAMKKLILNSIENPVPSTSSANNEGTICPGCEHIYDEDWMQCGLCKEWWHEECSI
ncbi:hypothetical protein AVEN_185319-1 [Araneus ventricosus]|uniref:DDE-1 domain-containing protein n=1 Tax=Araneus ventricosus TaxID=182803 RepID=A0A4Y2WVL8_ARAVE|nr:hypothetical protein AVEN_130626-1 [Araneus ventricosus]GBO41424.1 hypothetical protein AVEN_185319-1 [Araneus ventricosus]